MTTKVYRWDDTGAPLLKAASNIADMQGQLLAILDACLINGYGDKTSLGWNLTHSATNKRVYQIPGGMFLRVDETTSVYYWLFRGIRVRGYTDMIDIDSGIGGFPNAALINNASVISAAGENFAWDYALDDGQITTARRWVIVGDVKGFWLWIDTAAPTTYPDKFKFLFWFGEFLSEFTRDNYATILTGMDVASSYECGSTYVNMYGNSNYYSPSNGRTTIAAARKYDGLGDSVYTPLCSPTLTANPEMTSVGCFATPHPLPPVAAKVYLHPVDVMDTAEGWSNSTSRTVNVYRGRLPGVALLSQAAVGQAFDTFQDDMGNAYLLLPVGNYYSSNRLVALQTSNWR